MKTRHYVTIDFESQPKDYGYDKHIIIIIIIIIIILMKYFVWVF
jgi:hypothetical protein